MYNVTDIVGTDREPVKDYQKLWILFFFVYFFFAGKILINMFIGLIVDSYS